MSCCHLEKVTSELEGVPGVSWRGEMVHPVHADLELGKVGDLAPGSRIVCGGEGIDTVGVERAGS